MSIPVGDLFYEVGPDVGLAGNKFRTSQLHDDYILTPGNQALLRGLLRMKTGRADRWETWVPFDRDGRGEGGGLGG